jgi:hypothetical protein
MTDPCKPAVTVASSTTLVTVGPGAPSVVTAGGPPIVLVLQQSTVVVEAPGAPALIIEVCKQGPPGPPGPEGPEGPPGLGLDLSDVREDEQLVGAVDGVNKIYVLPYGDKALVADPGVKIKVFYNGQRLHEGGANDYTTSESGGAGTGFDTVTLIHVAPKPGDILTADYIVDPP